MSAIYERELDSQLNGLTGYVYGALMLLFGGIYVMVCQLDGSPYFTETLDGLRFIYFVSIPLLTMRSIAEERHQKTDQLLYSLPLSMTRIVLGKYLALVTVLAMPMAVMALYPLAVNALAASGTVHLRAAYSALAGFFFLGMALAAVGLFVSSLAESVGVAAGICFLVMLLTYFLTPLAGYIPASPLASLIALAVTVALFGLLVWRLTRNGGFAAAFTLALEAALGVCFAVDSQRFGGLFAELAGKLAVFDRFESFAYDILDLRAIAYFVSVAAVFLFLTVQSMERRRWAS